MWCQLFYIKMIGQAYLCYWFFSFKIYCCCTEFSRREFSSQGEACASRPSARYAPALLSSLRSRRVNISASSLLRVKYSWESYSQQPQSWRRPYLGLSARATASLWHFGRQPISRQLTTGGGRGEGYAGVTSKTTASMAEICHIDICRLLLDD